MFWILTCTALIYLLVNSPLIYSLLSAHRYEGIAALWGYAPQQFLFMAVIFPFATYSTFSALRALVADLSQKIPTNLALHRILTDWPVWVIGLGLIVTSVIGFAVYYSSAMSLDKLRPELAHRAITCIQQIESSTGDIDSPSARNKRNELSHKSKVKLATNIPVSRASTDEEIDNWVSGLNPTAFLQVVQNGRLQRELRLMEPTIHALNVFQFMMAILVGFCCLYCVVLCYIASKQLGYDGTNCPELSTAVVCSFWSLAFFAAYPICYSQYRSQIELFTGSGISVLQDTLTMIVIVVALLILARLDSSIPFLTITGLLRVTPVAAIGAASLLVVKYPELMRQLIGSETKVGTQVIVVLLTAIVGVFSIVQMNIQR